MRLPYSELWTTFRVTRPFWHPNQAGSLWRGVLGRSLRRAGCLRTPACEEPCAEPGRCAYSRLFDPLVPQPAPHRLLRGQHEAPPPLLPLVPIGCGRTFEVGERVELGVRCLGTLDSEDLERLRGTFAGLTELPLGRDGGRVELLAQRPPQHAVLASEPLATLPPHPESLRARIEFMTPTWIEHQQQLHPELDFPVLLTHGVRRLTVLSALYGSWTAADDAAVPHLRALAASVRTVSQDVQPLHFDRHSRERDQRHPLHGFLGSLTVEGPLAPLWPYLQMIALSHVGKATSFGLGRLRITAAPGPSSEALHAADGPIHDSARSVSA